MKKQTSQRASNHQIHLAKLILGTTFVLGFTVGLSTNALAQTVTYSSQLNVPYGHGYRDENTPYNPSSRDANGNRVIINGRILEGGGSTLTGGLGGDFFGSQNGFGGAGAGAIGNQLNVTTIGNYNTVIIDSTQINNGNQTVNTNDTSNTFHPPIAADAQSSGELNGEINLND